MGHYILNEDKEVVEVDMMEWAKWFGNGDTDNRRVKLDKFSNDTISVSTVFLGIDHNFGDEGEPVLFETMIFGGSLGEHYDEFQDRYCTWKEAEAGHKNAIKLILDDALEKRQWELVDEIKRKYPRIEK